MGSKEILQKVAGILEINFPNINEIGLLNGKMGLVLFFYHYGKYSNDKRYINIADELLDSVLDSAVIEELDLSFDKGVAGVIWGIRYLINFKFIDCVDNEIFPEIEDLLFKKNIIDCSSKTSISTLGMYLYSVIKKSDNIDRYHNPIMLILNKYEYYFLCLSIKPKSINYINSALSFLSILQMQPKYKIHTERIIFKITLYLSTLKTLEVFELCDLKILYKLLKSINSSLQEKLDILDKIEIVCNGEYNSLSPHNFWKKFIFLPEEILCLDIEEIDNYIDKNCMFVSNSSTLSVYGELASIGLVLMDAHKKD